MSEDRMHVEDAMDSKLAKTAVRVFVWLMPFVFTGMISLVVWQLREIRTELRALGEKQQTVSGDMRELNSKVDNGLIWRITELERRLNAVEVGQKTP